MTQNEEKYIHDTIECPKHGVQIKKGNYCQACWKELFQLLKGGIIK